MTKMTTNFKRGGPDIENLSWAKPVKVIAVTAGKGGVGKSNIATNLSLALAKLNKKILLLDADLGLGNIDIILGLEAKYNLSHVIRGICSLSDIILEGPSDVRVIPAASGTEFMTQLQPTQLAGLIDAFNELTDDLDYMIIDTAAGISDTVLSFTRSSQEIILVVCNEPASIVDTYALIKIMSKKYEATHFHILANMIRDPKEGREVFNALLNASERLVDVHLDYSGAIPFDHNVHDAAKKQKPFYIAYPDSPASYALKELAEQVEQWPSKSLLGGNTSFFLERLVSGNY